MKHPLFALAGVAAMAALASDPSPRSGDIALDGFENYTAGQSIASASDSWTGSADAVVTAYGNGEAPTGIAFPAPFTDAGDQYLAIDTGSDEVTCSAESSAATVYIDTLAQFSVLKAGESAPVASDAKLLLWLQEDIDNGVTTTNLHVRGGYYDSVTPESDRDYKLNKACEPGIWYRVTIEAYNNILTEYATARLVGEGDDPITVSGFVIKIDGQEVAAEEQVYAPGKLEELCPDQTGTSPGVDDGLSQDMFDLFSVNKLIPAIGEATAATVTGVAFKGSGAIDDLVVSANDPASFLLSWPTNLTAVSYVLGLDDAPVYPTLSSGSISITAQEGTSVSLTGAIGDYSKTVTGTVTAGGSLSLPDLGIVYFFPRTNTLGQDGTAEHPYEIADEAGLKALQAAVAAGYGADLCYQLTADITLTAPWPGIGIQNGKDLANSKIAAEVEAFDTGAFRGTFDGQNHTISGFQMVGRDGNSANAGKEESQWEGLDYCGFFNSTYGATIQNLKIVYSGSLFAVDTSSTTKESGATFVGVAKNSTLTNLTSLQKDASTAVSASKGFGGIVGYTMAGTTVDSCTNNVNMTSLANNKCGGIAMITQNGTGNAVIRNCQNNGTQTTGSSNQEYGGIVGYVGVNTTIADCETTVGRFLKHQSNTVTLQGVNKGDASVLAYHGSATPGLNFATVDNGVATFVADNALAAGNAYKVMGPSATATYEFTAPGSISFNTALATPTYAITAAAGFKVLEPETVDGITTYTAVALASVTVTVNGGANATAAWTVNGNAVATAPTILTEGDTYEVVYTANEGYEFTTGATTSASGTVGTENILISIADATASSAPADDYVVTINGSDVVVTPSAEDLAAVQTAVIAGGGTLDVTDVAAVNAALAAEIGSTGIPSWQALFLGLPPTEAGLESFKIDSISFNGDGNVVLTLPASVELKTGRGVNIALNLMGSDDLSSWTFIEAATGTTFAPVTPASGETKKFYKVVAVFSATPAE